MKKYIISLLCILLLWGCDKSDSILGVDDSFNIPDPEQTNQSPDTDDPNYNRINDYRNYVFAGQSNLAEENLFIAGDNAPVTYKFESVFIPEGEIVEKENYSMETPIAVSLNNVTTLFFQRFTEGGKGKNLASGWCFSNTTAEGWSPIVETRKYAPYGYEKNGAFSLGTKDNQVLFASKGILTGDAEINSWLHYPEALRWSSRDLSRFNPEYGGGVLPAVSESKFGLLMHTESFAETVQRLVVAEIKYDTLDMDGSIPIYGNTPVDTIWAYTAMQSPRVPSLVISEDQGQSWNDYAIATDDTIHFFGGNYLYIKGGTYDGSIITVGYDITRKILNQAVYRYADGDMPTDSLWFACDTTNITNDMPLGLSTPEIILNPVTNRVELIEGFTNKLVLWSIGIDEIFNGEATWIKECELINRGDRYAQFADTYPVGSIVDEANGVQEIYLSMGSKSPSRKAIYKLTRDLNTPELASWITGARSVN